VPHITAVPMQALASLIPEDELVSGSDTSFHMRFSRGYIEI